MRDQLISGRPAASDAMPPTQCAWPDAMNPANATVPTNPTTDPSTSDSRKAGGSDTARSRANITPWTSMLAVSPSAARPANP